MKNSSKSVKTLIAVVLFIILYLPISLVWDQIRPAYSRTLADIAEPVVNIIEFSDASYRIDVGQNEFLTVARVRVGGEYTRIGEYELEGARKADLVSYNLSLWVTMLLATGLFVDRRTLLKFLIITPLILIAWHVCDLTIFAKNTRWRLVKDLHDQYPAYIDYSYSWNWFWFWAQELNRRIIDPFLPLLLWLIFCARSFFVPSASR